MRVSHHASYSDDETRLTTELPSGARHIHHPVSPRAVSGAEKSERLQRELGQNLSNAKREADLRTISGHLFVISK